MAYGKASAVLFAALLKGADSLQPTPVSLMPGKLDLNPICYECPNETYAETVMKGDPLVHFHAKVNGTCSSQGYDHSLINDPVFKDAKLFLKGKHMREAVLKRTMDAQAHPENIDVKQVSLPTPLPGEMLIRVLGSSVNPSDVDLIKLPVGPAHMGNDVSGVVVHTTIGCGTRLKKGDEVYASNAVVSGAWADYAAIPCFGVSKKPKGLNFTEAGVLAEVGATGMQSLQWAADPKTKRLDNMTVVVLGGAGGTGHVGIQIAKALGAAQVITTCGPDHFDFVKAMGADRVINYHKEQWYDVLANQSVDVVYDCVAQKGTGEQAFPKLKQGGHYAALLPYGLAGADAKKQRPDIKQKAIFCTDCAFHAHLDELTELVDAGKLRPHVDQAFELADVRGAVNLLMTGHATGKVAIVMSPPTVEQLTETVIV